LQKCNVRILPKDQAQAVSIGKGLLKFSFLDIDVEHIVNLFIDYECDFKTELYVPNYKGGHLYQVIEAFITNNQKLIQKIKEIKHANGCVTFTLQDKKTGTVFKKSCFPENWTIDII